MSTIEVKNKNILVTGGANGIGRELVKTLCPFNKVYALDRDQEKLTKLAQEFPGVVPLVCDLSDWDATRQVLEASLPEVVHCTVNNAGIGAESTLLTCTEEALDKVIAVNTRAVINICQIVAKRIIVFNEKQAEEQSKVWASIVNVSSLAARFPTRVSLAYNISKAAVDMITKSAALELGPHNVRVNSVNPNIVMGTDLATAWMGVAGGQLKDRLVARTPLQKVVNVRDVVNTIIFLLAADHVGMIHGESVVVDGGYSVM